MNELVYYSTSTQVHQRMKRGAEMDFNSALPIYVQVMALIKREIVAGRMLPGSKLPSVREMAVSYTINPNTVSRVYRELELEGVCFTKRGMGTFVTEDEGRIARLRSEMASELVERFLEGMEQLGISAEETLQMIRAEQEIRGS